MIVIAFIVLIYLIVMLAPKKRNTGELVFLPREGKNEVYIRRSRNLSFKRKDILLICSSCLISLIVSRPVEVRGLKQAKPPYNRWCRGAISCTITKHLENLCKMW